MFWRLLLLLLVFWRWCVWCDRPDEVAVSSSDMRLVSPDAGRLIVTYAPRRRFHVRPERAKPLVAFTGPKNYDALSQM